LLVDDSQTTRSFAVAALEAGGELEITEAGTGVEALKILPRQQFDLVITDINMPDINGLELIRFTRTHSNYKDTPVIIISTEGRDTDQKRALDLGANEYITKPFTPEALVAAVRRHLPHY
jgi:two-component system chemotaxis response regulator CheY